MTPETSPLITAIAAVLRKDYAIGPDSATSIVRRVLEMYAAESVQENETQIYKAVA